MKAINQYFVSSIIILSLLSILSCSTKESKVVPNSDDRPDVRAKLEPLIEQNVIPRLKEAPFISRPTFIKAGKIEGTTELVGKIDEVTKMVRRLIWFKLSGINGINLVQRHSLSKIKNIRKAHDISRECKTFTEPEYYLIIDHQLSGDNLYIDIVAQAAENGNKGVPGFSTGFSIKADNILKNMLKKQDWDEYLQGTKYYPVEANDKDSIADFLAYNLVCILQDIYYKRSNSAFYIDSGNLGTYEKQICENHLRPYLIQYGLTIVDSPDEASHIIKPHTGESSGVSTLWVEVKDKNTGRTLKGGAAKVYYYKPPPPPFRINEYKDRFRLKLDSQPVNHFPSKGLTYIGNSSVFDLALEFDNSFPEEIAANEIFAQIEGIGLKKFYFTDRVGSKFIAEDLKINKSGISTKPIKFSIFCKHDGKIYDLGHGQQSSEIIIDTIIPPGPENIQIKKCNEESFVITWDKDIKNDTDKYIIRQNGHDDQKWEIDARLNTENVNVKTKPEGIFYISAIDRALNESNKKIKRLPEDCPPCGIKIPMSYFVKTKNEIHAQSIAKLMIWTAIKNQIKTPHTWAYNKFIEHPNKRNEIISEGYIPSVPYFSMTKSVYDEKKQGYNITYTYQWSPDNNH